MDGAHRVAMAIEAGAPVDSFTIYTSPLLEEDDPNRFRTNVDGLLSVMQIDTKVKSCFLPNW